MRHRHSSGMQSVATIACIFTALVGLPACSDSDPQPDANAAAPAQSTSDGVSYAAVAPLDTSDSESPPADDTPQRIIGGGDTENDGPPPGSGGSSGGSAFDAINNAIVDGSGVTPPPTSDGQTRTPAPNSNTPANDASPAPSGNSPSVVAPVDPQIPQFTSAESLIAHYNALVAATPQDLRAIAALLHPENEVQFNMVKLMKATIALAELDVVMRKAFNEGFNASQSETMTFPTDPVRIESVSDGRVHGVFGEPGRTFPFELVKVGAHWWISGLTLEKDPEFEGFGDEMDDAFRVLSAIAEIAPEYIDAIDMGLYDEAYEVRDDVMDEVVKNHPELKPIIDAIIDG